MILARYFIHVWIGVSEISLPSTRENSSKSEEEKVLMKSRLTFESEGLSAEEDGVVTLRPRLAKRKA